MRAKDGRLLPVNLAKNIEKRDVILAGLRSFGATNLPQRIS